MDARDLSNYLMSFEEVSWGVALVALTMAIHGLGVVATLLAGQAMQRRFRRATLPSAIAKLVVATWLLVTIHLTEVVVWALFLQGLEAFPNFSVATYYTLMQYTTVGSDLHLPDRWRLLSGMIAIAGLLTFALSTSVLFALAQRYYVPLQMVGLQGPTDREPR